MEDSKVNIFDNDVWAKSDTVKSSNLFVQL